MPAACKSAFCAAPSEAARDLIDQVREPEMTATGERVPGL